jgi:branched-chain amino acid transport system substrate-binding protein
MKNKIITLLVVFMLLLASFAFAGGKQEKAEKSGAAEETASAEQSGAEETGGVVVDKWEIPFLDVLTGPIAGIGEYLLWGAEQAAEEINAAGGIAGKPVEIVAIDTGMEPNKGVVEMAKLAEGDALTVMGPVPEPVIMASMPTAIENGLFAFTATTSYEYAAEFFPWAISWFSPTEEKLPPIVTEWANRVGVSKVVQFIENYGPWPGMAKAHTVGLEKAGVEAGKDVELPTDAVTFDTYIVTALKQDPDGLIMACNAEKAAKIIKALKGRGWEDMEKILIFNSADDAALYTTGEDALNGTMIYNYIDSTLDTPRWNAYKEAYMEDHDGMSPPSLSTHYYDAVYMIKEAIENTGITGDPAKLKEERRKIRDYCEDVQNFEGLMFSWSMENFTPTDKPLYLFEIQDGQKEFVAEVRPE